MEQKRQSTSMPTPKDFDTHFSILFFTVPDIYLQALNKKKILYSDETKLEFSGFHNQFFIAIAASVTNLCLHLRGFHHSFFGVSAHLCIHFSWKQQRPQHL